MSHYLIQNIRLTHCKRGPAACQDCREMNQEQICLLQLYLPGASLAQRRMIQVELEGETVWREYEILRTFETPEQARAYADQHPAVTVQLASFHPPPLPVEGS